MQNSVQCKSNVTAVHKLMSSCEEQKPPVNLLIADVIMLTKCGYLVELQRELETRQKYNFSTAFE